MSRKTNQVESNPIRGLTIQQVDAVFRATKDSGGPASITAWGNSGSTGERLDQVIRLYGSHEWSGSDSPFVAAAALNAYSGHYPLSRFLDLTLNTRLATVCEGKLRVLGLERRH